MTKNKATTIAKNSAYWREREWQLEQLKKDDRFNRHLKKYYDQLIRNILADIERELSSLARRNGVSIENARQVVTNTDVSDYEFEARQLVQLAERLRADGKDVTYNDFTDKVNERMRVYNATMRINRLELLKSEIGLRVVEASLQLDQDMQTKIAKDYTDELRRQTGILDVVSSASVLKLWTSSEVAKQIMAQINGATFSDRIWANQDALKARLDAVLSVEIVEGRNPRETARKLRKLVKSTVNNQRYVTERLARTESARVQHKAQLKSLKDNGFKWCKWYAEPGACKVCRAIASDDPYNKGYGVYKTDEVPDIPVHPNCRCSIAAEFFEDD